MDKSSARRKLATAAARAAAGTAIEQIVLARLRSEPTLPLNKHRELKISRLRLLRAICALQRQGLATVDFSGKEVIAHSTEVRP